MGIVPTHHEPQTLSLPQEAHVLLWETEAPEKSKRRGLPQGGRRQTSRGCSQRHPAHLCSPHPLRGDPQPVYWGETLIWAHHVVFLYQPLQSKSLPDQRPPPSLLSQSHGHQTDAKLSGYTALPGKRSAFHKQRVCPHSYLKATCVGMRTYTALLCLTHRSNSGNTNA